MALFERPSWAAPSCQCLPTLLVDLWSRWQQMLQHPTGWTDIYEEDTCKCNTDLWAALRVQCRYDRPLIRRPCDTSITRSKMMGEHWADICLYCMTIWDSQGTTIQHGATRINEIWVNLWHVLPETWTELEALFGEEYTHNIPEAHPRMVEGIQLPGHPEVAGRFQGVIIDGIEWYANNNGPLTACTKCTFESYSKLSLLL